MTSSTLIALIRESLAVALTASAPPLAAALVVGLTAGVLQAATQIQEQSVSVVLRLGAVLAVLGIAGPWIGAQLARFATACLELVPRVGM